MILNKNYVILDKSRSFYLFFHLFFKLIVTLFYFCRRMVKKTTTRYEVS